MKNLKFFFSIIVSGLIYCSNAFAYLDPGTFSIIISAIVSFIAVLIFYIKNVYYFFKNKFNQLISFFKKEQKKKINLQ